MQHDPARLEALTLAETLPRQTPKNDFGEVLSRTVGHVVNGGVSLVRGAFGAMAPLSAAVATGVQTVTGLVSRGGVRSVVAQPGTAAALAGLRLDGGGAGPPSLEATLQNLQNGDELSGGQYLVLQHAMQLENQQYTALSNVLKVRSDSAKAAINNIR